MGRREHPSRLVHHYATDGTAIGQEQTGTGTDAGTGSSGVEEGGN
jgi:hypothetical protein